MTNKDDWRLTSQMKYLYRKRLLHIPYEVRSIDWDHEHCEFCWEKIDSPAQTAYCTTDKYHWICEDCFRDFHEMFYWDAAEADGENTSLNKYAEYAGARKTGRASAHEEK